MLVLLLPSRSHTGWFQQQVPDALKVNDLRHGDALLSASKGILYSLHNSTV